MNVKLAFTPASRNPVDLLAVVLDEEKTLHAIDDPAVAEHVRRAGEAFRARTLKREYFATLPEGAPARALVVYWSPQLKAWNLWENVKTFTARALRLARDYRLPRVGLVLNTAEAAPFVGKAVEGAVIGSLHVRPLPLGEGRVPGEGGLAHDPRPPRPPGRRRGAQGALRLGRRERQPRARPDQRAGQRGHAGVDRQRGRRDRARGRARDRGARPGGAARQAATRASCASAPAAPTRAAWSCCATCRARPPRRRWRSSARASPSTPAASASSPATRCGR